MATPTLVLQTTYAELVDRCATAAFDASFSGNGAFTPKIVNGRRYWYFQSTTDGVRSQRYVGPETPDLLKQIEEHKAALDDERERRSLVSTLVRSFGMPQPIPEIGATVEALAKAGVFRLRGVLVGTVAYQTYSAILGQKLPSAILQTGDIDIAQFGNVSVAVEDKTPPVLEILKEADNTFRPLLTIHKGHVTSYTAKNGLRVDFLTPNEGPDTNEPQPLPAFQTDAQPLRFLNYLIYDSIPAVLLYGAGIYVTVPSPQRYAIHKLIISRRRSEGTGKREKDIHQVEGLFSLLWQKRSYELKSAWEEAYSKGNEWRRLLVEGLSELSPHPRDGLLKIIDHRRSFVTGLDLTFNSAPPFYDFSRDVITFEGKTNGGIIKCAISREALADHFGANNTDQKGRIEIFNRNRSAIEILARKKYLIFPIEEPGSVLIKTSDVEALRMVSPN